MAVEQARVLDALKVVQDPDLHRDIVSLGFIKNLSIDGDDANVQIRVHNKGTPISSELLPLLFQPFRRGDGDRPRGLGLGLYIVQQIVMAHGGSIEVTSTLEDGTTFVARLPRANSSAASPS